MSNKQKATTKKAVSKSGIETPRPTKGNKTFKIRFIPQDKRAKARNYICELEQKATTHIITHRIEFCFKKRYSNGNTDEIKERCQKIIQKVLDTQVR
jgi:hypothetical protein